MMAKLKFSDGVEIDVDGEFRTLKLKDGWYVIGDGMCIPAIDEVEANDMVSKLNSFTPEGGEINADEVDDQGA